GGGAGATCEGPADCERATGAPHATRASRQGRNHCPTSVRYVILPTSSGTAISPTAPPIVTIVEPPVGSTFGKNTLTPVLPAAHAVPLNACGESWPAATVTADIV